MGLFLDQPIVNGLFKRYVDSMKLRKFYMHSDEHAWEHFLEALHLPHNFDIRNTPDALKSRVLEEIVKPSNIGCGHIKGIVQNPALYGAPPGLAQVRACVLVISLASLSFALSCCAPVALSLHRASACLPVRTYCL